MADVKISPGRFDKTIELLAISTARGSKGQTVREKSSYRRAYAEVIEVGLSEEEIKGNIKITRGLTINTYALPIDTSFEVRYKGRDYKITEITPIGIYIKITAYE